MSDFSDAELERYARQIILHEFGGARQARLKAAHVVVIGAGGIGCPALAALAGAGVGRLTIIDDDRVGLDNLHRQPLFTEGDIGALKAEAAAARLREMNGDIDVKPVIARIDASSAPALIAGADLVLDGCDNFATRLAVSDACVASQIALLSAAIGKFQGQVALFRGHQSGQPCYRCFVGDAYDADDCDACAEVGVLGTVTGLVGHWAATEAARALTGFGDDMAGKLLLIDALAPAMRVMRLPPDPACRACGRSG